MPSSPSLLPERIVGVAVPVPGLGLLSYRVPSGLTPPSKGARVVVPLGGRKVTGCVVDARSDPPPDAELKDIVELLDESPFLPPAIVDLALWVGDYYASGPGEALTIAMPPAARSGKRDSFVTETRAELVAGGDDSAHKGAKQRQALALLRDEPGLTLQALTKRGVSTATIRALAAKGRVRLLQQVRERDPFALNEDEGGGAPWSLPHAVPVARELTAEQSQALEELRAEAGSREFRTVLLHGVTGSGKTELYLRLASEVTAGGRRVLIMVPEIALTPSIAGMFRARFGARVAIQHSGLSTGERHDQWHRIRRGDVDVVVGTRSAVFAPLEGVGLIVVDEEHEASYKQEESPRYNGRDVAVVRGRMEGALVLLGSATPSLESAANAQSGRYGRIRLTRRILDRPLASVHIVDMRQEYAAHGPDVIFSAPLAAAIEDRLTKGEQSLVLLNRRGFASVIFCRQCGSSMECPRCSVALTYHRAARRVRCHYCDYTTGVPKRCGACGGEYLEQSGFGTERLEAELREKFPDARVARVDRDTIRRRGAITRVISDVSRGHIDILVGTQMIAKGHDFPAVTLAGVISADVGLGRADFRAAERTFQLLTQVVGRAGRGDTPGEAFIQTLYPDHYSVRAAAAQDYAQFFERELEFRTSMHYPPDVALVNVVVRAKSPDAAMAGAADLVSEIRRAGVTGRVVGPAPAAIAKIKNEFRAQFFLKSPPAKRRAIRLALDAALAARPELKRRTIVDVDPVSVI